MFCLIAGFVRVLENLESPGILLWRFPGLEGPGKGLLVLESSGNLLNSSKKTCNVWQTVRRINIKLIGVNGVNGVYAFGSTLLSCVVAVLCDGD